MEKQTKNIITREWIKKELLFHTTADIRYSLVLSVGFALFCIPFTTLMLFWITSATQIIFLKILYFFLIALLGYTPVGIFLWGLITCLIERGRLSKGEFEVSVAKVSFKGEKLVGRHLEEFLHLKDFGNVRVDHTTFQLADRGDEYYVIHYKKNVKLYYSLEMYEYREK